MIKGLMGTTGVTVSGGNTSLPYVGSNSSNPMTGMVRVNMNDLEVFNGSSWQQLPSSYATVSLDQDVLDIIQWARTQRTLERNRSTLIANNPALENAYKAILRAEANFDILSKFVENDEPSVGSVLVGYNFNTP
jgi:hypothetical protein